MADKTFIYSKNDKLNVSYKMGQSSQMIEQHERKMKANETISMDFR
jgi:hypothetical protein